MAWIQLTKGLQSEVDDNIFHSLNKFNWYASGVRGKEYAARRLGIEHNRSLVYLHHQVLDVFPWELDGKEVDHWDNNRLNNKINNLRIVTHEINMQNGPKDFDQKGICFDWTFKRYKVYIKPVGQKRINVGTYQTLGEAIAARTAKLNELGIILRRNML